MASIRSFQRSSTSMIEGSRMHNEDLQRFATQCKTFMYVDVAVDSFAIKSLDMQSTAIHKPQFIRIWSQNGVESVRSAHFCYVCRYILNAIF